MDVLTPGLADPVPRDLAMLLRRAVLDHALGERRRVHPPVLHVGVPGVVEQVLAVRAEDPTDHGLRTDVVSALVAAAQRDRPPRPPLVWLTRAGELELQDVDLAWSAAAGASYAEAGLPLVMVVVNRREWRDPRSGTGRRWRRLRQR